MAEKTAPRVLVIGAGSAGLLTAHALQMQGAHVTVFESDSAIDARPRDWDFGIYWAQVPLSECLPGHIRNQVEDAQVDNYRAGEDEVMPIYNGLTEELLIKLPIPYNIRLKRRAFLRVISQDLDIKYSKRLASVSSDGRLATATFIDGSTETGDLLIGAEGAHSLVRDYLVGEEAAKLEPTDVVGTLGIVSMSPEGIEKFKRYGKRLFITFHPNGYFSWIGKHEAHSENPADWTFLAAMTWKPSAGSSYDSKSLRGADILADAKQRAKEFGPNINEMWQSIPDDTQLWHNRLTDWYPERPWDSRNGTVTLVGDAAHSMTFHRGQGLNNAIHDVASLARATKEHGFTPEAIKAYEGEMVPRGQEAVKGSRANTMATHDWETLLESPLFKMGTKPK